MTDLCSNRAVKINAKTKQILNNISNTNSNIYSLIFYPSTTHTYDLAIYENNEWNNTFSTHIHNKIVTNCILNETEEEKVFQTISEYSGFLCLNTEINISNIGSSNSNGIIIEESEMPRTVANDNKMFNFFDIQDIGLNFQVTPENHIINQTDLLLNPDYNVSILSPGKTNSYTLNSLPEQQFQEIYRKYTPNQYATEDEGILILTIDPYYINSHYVKNFIPKVFKITLPPLTSMLIFAKTEFSLTPRPGSVKNLFMVNV